ncbi:hypothetical protein OPT61_g2452 [Boeremia exigua]|uniref:Uncharacterized protein n=1 Tax=Boeremia exigua TaxID=749465 RepID=A0ACC2ILG6_9PLEO|nr:hypothetical protein OPT61_g2452 [Boeremia exigua]
MEEPSKGKRHTQPPKPSRLREVHQVPDSDSIVPDTQPGVNDYPIDEDIDAEDVKFLQRCSANTGTVPPQSFPSPPDDFRLSKPVSVTVLSPAPVFGRPAISPLLKTASIENTANNGYKKVTSTLSATPPTLQSPSNVVPVDVRTPSEGDAIHVHDQYQKDPHTDATVNQGTEPFQQVVPSTRWDSADSMARCGLSEGESVQSIAPPARPTKKNHTTRKEKRGKKTLLHRPLLPWPPRQDLMPSGRDTPPLANKTKRGGQNLTSVDVDETIAIEPQPEAAFGRNDGHCKDEASLVIPRAKTRCDGVAKIDASDKHCIETSRDVGQGACPQNHDHMGGIIAKPVHIADQSLVSNGQSSRSSHGNHDCFSQMPKTSAVVEKTPEDTSKVSRPNASLLSITENSDTNIDFDSQHQREVSCRQALLGETTTSFDQVSRRHSPQRDTQEMLHGVHDRIGAVRVNKAQRSPRSSHMPPNKVQAVAISSLSTSNMTALNTALDTLRGLYLADQCRMENHLTSVTNMLEDEKTKFQKTISEQLTTIAELNFKLQMTENRLKRLSEMAMPKQKYIAGLQQDHESMQKETATFREKTEQTLQNQIAEVMQEREMIRNELETTLTSSSRTHKAMLKTMKETHAHYVMALSREKELKTKLSAQTSMYDEEKSRRIELETQLLSRFDSFKTDLQGCAAARGDESSVEECLLILRKLESLPLLTSHDVRRVEVVLDSLYERSNAASLLAKRSETNSLSVENVQQLLRDEIQGVRKELLRHHEAIASGQQAQEANQSLERKLYSQTQITKQLEVQVDVLRRSETALNSQLAQLENEKATLQASVQELQKLPQESDLKMVKLHDQVSQKQNELLLAEEETQQRGRRILEQEREFSDYRTNAMARLCNLDERFRLMTEQAEARTSECNMLQQDGADLRAKLATAEIQSKRLSIEVTECKATNQKLQSENATALEKEGTTRTLLESINREKRRLEEENGHLKQDIEQHRTSLGELKSIESTLNEKCLYLQRELCDLQNLKIAVDEQLRKANDDTEARLQQVNTEFTARLSDLGSRLTISEQALKQTQAHLRHTEAAQKDQIDYHEQKANARFRDLASESEREQEKLITKHLQEMEVCRQNANTRINEMIQETQKCLEAANMASSKICVPNTQDSIGLSGSAQQLQTGKTRRKVDRTTNSAMIKVPSGDRRLNPSDKQSMDHRPESTHCHREGSAGYFEEEFQTRYGRQLPPHNQETQLSVIDPEAESIPETQDFESAHKAVTQFETAESPLFTHGDLNREETSTDLSTIPSESLSEMLLDNQTITEQALAESRQLSSSRVLLQTPSRTARHSSGNDRSIDSQGRPRSRANTASRLMPLAPHASQRRRITADVDSQRVVQRAFQDSAEDDDEIPPRSELAEGTVASRKHARKLSSQDAVQSSDSGEFGDSVREKVSLKKQRTSTQSSIQQAQSMSATCAPYTPAPTGRTTRGIVHHDPSSTSGRRSSNRRAETGDSQSGTPRLSSTRNTRSKTNRYADRFGQELDRR